MAKKPDRDKHINLTRNLKSAVESALGTYAEGGPPVAITRVEWDGMTKHVDDATDEELGQITSIVLHVV